MYSSPFRHFTAPVARGFSCDLHVLATPPAFVLSQDQTLHLIIILPFREGIHAKHLILVGRVCLGATRPWSSPAFVPTGLRRMNAKLKILAFVRAITRILSRPFPRKIGRT